MSQDQDFTPRGVSIAAAAAQLGVSIPTINRKLAARELQAVKIGKKTVVTVESINAFWANLPAAQFRAPKQKLAA